MTEHSKTDGLSAQAPNVAASGATDTPVTPVRPVAATKIECNACPVLCQISAGRSGACDRYANHEGVLIRVDPVLVLNRALKANEPALVSFAPGTSEEVWAGDLMHANDVFITGVGSSTTYPDYKPAPFIVGSQIDGVDMVTVVTEASLVIAV